MTIRIYMSEVSPFWTFERQETALAAFLPGAEVFRDHVTRRDRQGHSKSLLTQRENLVRPTSQENLDETVYVSSLAVLAWSADDLLGFSSALARRGSKLVSVDDGEWDDLLAAWHAARTKARLTRASLMGGEVLKRKMADLYAPKVEAIRDRWGNPSYDVVDLLAEAGVSRNTAIKYLGMTREEAIRKNKASLTRKYRNK